MSWIKIAESIKEIQFRENNIAEVDADGKIICIARHNDTLYAFPRNCPHAGGYFCEGYLDVLGNIVCPIHRYKFSLKNGRNVTGEGYYLKTWPIRTDEAGVFVNLEGKKLFGLF